MNPALLIQQGAAHHKAGRLAQAQAFYRQALALAPGHPDALHLLGVLAHQAGQSQAGEQIVRQAIAANPAPAYQTSLGHILLAQGRAAEAEAAYRAALRAIPNEAGAHHNLGKALHEAGRVTEAEASFRHALKLQRDNPDIRLDLGNLLVATGRAAEAETCLRAALRRAPGHALVWNALGLALTSLGRHAEALDAYETAIKLAPDYANARTNCAACLAAMERYEESDAAYAKLTGPGADPALLHAHARVLMCLKRFEDAEPMLRRVLAAIPDDTDTLHHLSVALSGLDRFEEALPLLQGLAEARPEDATVQQHLGLVYRDLGRWPEALPPLARAAELAPDDADKRSTYAQGLLANGDFERGWDEFRWRTEKPGNARLATPEWNGSPTDQTVIIYAEQGVGDTLQFCRFIPAAGEKTRVVVACQPSLKRLLSTLPNVAELADGLPTPRYDLHCPIMSLPRILDIPPERLGETVPYLRAEESEIEAWRARFAPLPGLRVGLVWAGNPQYPQDRRRSVPFDTVAPLLDTKGVSFVSLQMGDARAAWGGRFAFDAAPHITDYASTASAMEALDLIISVDTSAAHLAGALGRRVWMMNRADTDWRWRIGRSDTPWYPTMRIFRQPRPGDWASVVEEVQDALRDAASQAASRSLI